MAYLGNVPARSFISFERQVFTIVNSQTAYTLSHSVTNENDIRLVVNNVVQEPGSGKAYTATGTTLTLSAALTNGTDEMYCVFLGRATATNAPGAGSVGTAQLAADAVTNAKIADDAISDEQLDPTVITGQTAETSIATDDLILLSDTSASGALKKMTRANFVSGVGETNTPMFFVSGGNQTISHNTNTKMTISSEAFDTDNCFDLGGNNRFTPNKEGKYFFTLSLFSPSLDDIDYWTANIKKNGGSGGGFSGVQRNYNNVCYNGILTANGSSDYFEAYCEQESGSNRTIAVSEFSAFYIGN
jgi:hypothetical protein